MSHTITELLTLDELAAAFAEAALAVVPGGEANVQFESPRRAEFGDVATNVAFALAKTARRAPNDLALAIIERAMTREAVHATVAEASATGGFINLRLVPAFWQRVVAMVLREGERYGRKSSSGKRISLEYGSANPTGPLVVVQGRTLALGSTLAECFRFTGDEVTVEWIVNDAGSQLDTLGRSLYARYRQLADPSYPFPEDGYPGEYVVPLARELRERDGARWENAPESEWLAVFAQYGRDRLVAQQREICDRFRARFDHWQSEKELHASGALARGIEALRERGYTYEQDGAIWMRTTALGDDKDRVLVRSDGRPTYLAPDVAYHYEKLQRADQALLILGPDHHGYVARLAAIATAFGRPGAIEVLIAQLITLKRGDEIVSMSKRAGEVVTLEDIIDEVGVDAARFFFLMLSFEQPLTFDLALAKQQSTDNPVYYVQYGHARICAVLRRAEESAPEPLALARSLATTQDGELSVLGALVEPSELTLMRRLAEFPATVEGVARNRAPHRLPKYAREVAADFHQFYDTCKILVDDRELAAARLVLAMAAHTVLAATLALCGVSAPEKM
jgi:arginyl-tRNA synthetase